MRRKGTLFVICGPSGVGKGTVCKELLKNISGIDLSISATTREIRKGEVEGVNYYFIDKDKFEEMIENDEFLEYAQVYDNFYGTPKKYVIEQLNIGKDVILEIDPQGAMQIKEKFKEGIFIFLLPPSMKELKNRIIGRGRDSEDNIKKRLKCAYEEIDFIKEYDYYIINDDLLKAVNNLASIIKAERCRVKEDICEIVRKYKEE
ncbi:guanylate kinase [Paramaledivibacter caminithermalis]|jgi:guanylate kinase|uniref:Guanylate kinase n=1 Tax=Paramaledivibacter caminithermalis (strain DSM 15212 / CIP 107654 / DViRD3) TaxID=1121301 RepID=A0A1M6NH62_PARC5|nr:guanylate kinase [Paramaledivibacter caminithermalis]SHJ94963.1 guanylate kinase [Paramaledivibacter caminithermalis DSM 15212]